MLLNLNIEISQYKAGQTINWLIYISLDRREDRHVYNLHVPIGIK